MSQGIFTSLASFLFVILFLHPVFVFGSKHRSFEGKIVGGNFTKITKYAHAVFLSIKCGESNLICGASVLNQQILLTAAHCLGDCKRHMDVEALAGNENLNQVTVVRTVNRMAIHRNYVEESLENDIAIVFMAKMLPLDARIKRVIIRRKCPNTATAFVAGWGLTNDITRERTMLLKTVKQDVPPQNDCVVVGDIKSGMLCAGNKKVTKDRPTRGDSGSGLVTPDYQLIGIVSFRNDKYPGLLIYSDVSYFYDWITYSVKKIYCKSYYTHSKVFF